jgi:hypothetical protein
MERFGANICSLAFVSRRLRQLLVSLLQMLVSLLQELRMRIRFTYFS